MDHDYWICDASETADVSGWFGVVDECSGGIIAYFSTEELAMKFINSNLCQSEK
jgi:hypothetical protein